MNTRADLDAFLGLRIFAVAGASRSDHATSTGVCAELRRRGYRLLPVNPNATELRGEPCYPTLSALPVPVEGVIFFTPPSRTADVLRQAIDCGLRHVWIQPGAESDEAEEVCAQEGLVAISRRCILSLATYERSPH